MRRIAIAIALTTIAAQSDAARLCRDSKGLFTPCIGTPARTPPVARHRDDIRAGTTTSNEAPAATSEARQRSADARSVKPERPVKPALLVRGKKSCRDSKGLFTPC